MGPRYNRINFSIKTALPSSCSVLRKIAAERGILFILTLPVKASHCGTLHAYFKID